MNSVKKEFKIKMKVTDIFKVIIIAFLVITFTVSMISCKEAPVAEETIVTEERYKDEEATEEDFFEGEGKIGAAGGCVYDPGGANVTIPEGALDRDVSITVETLNKSKLPAPTPPLTRFLGAASFGPDGLTFKTNVTITIQLKESRTAGTVMPLFVYDVKKKEFIETDVIAAVNPDGRTASANVTHFSIWAMLDGVSPEAISGCFEEALNSGYDPQAAFDMVVNYVLSWAELGECDLESRLEFPKLVGVLVSLMYETDGVSPPELVYSKGETSGPASYIAAGDSHECHWVSGGKEKYTIYSLVVEVFIEYVKPKIDILRDVIRVQQGETVTISTYLKCCGETPVPEREVEFYLSPLFGSIFPTSDTTDGNGVAETTYTAPDKEDTTTLEVQYTFQTYEKDGTGVYQDPQFGKSKLIQKYKEITTTIGDSVIIVVGRKYKVHIDDTDAISAEGLTATFYLTMDVQSECGIHGDWSGSVRMYFEVSGYGWDHGPVDMPVSFTVPETGGSFECWRGGAIIAQGNIKEDIMVITVNYFDPEGGCLTYTFQGPIEPIQE